MTALIIICAILLILLFIMLLRIKITISMHGENSVVKLKVLGITWLKLPQKEKKKKINLREYSYSAIQKKKKKEQKRLEKEKIKAERNFLKKVKKENNKSENAELSLGEKISLITSVVKVLLKKVFKYLRVDITVIDISVATGDAAKTAIAYSVARQSVALLIDLLESVKNVRKNRKTYISVKADFVSEKSHADIDIGFSIKTWQILSAGLAVLIEYIKNMQSKIKDKLKGKNNGRN